jgi:RimJ/RimL family protein N-acetyltransferase
MQMQLKETALADIKVLISPVSFALRLQGVTVGPLTDVDTDDVNDTWLYKSGKSRPKIKKLIATEPSAAVRVNGELVAWCVLNEHGAIGMLYTKEQHRGKGYAALSVCEFAKVLRDRPGAVPALYSHIVVTNKQSIRLFERRGWVRLHDAEWILYAPQH